MSEFFVKIWEILHVTRKSDISGQNAGNLWITFTEKLWACRLDKFLELLALCYKALTQGEGIGDRYA